MNRIAWKTVILVGLGTVLVLWATRGLVGGFEELALVLGIALMASGSTPELSRAKQERAALAARLEALELEATTAAAGRGH